LKFDPCLIALKSLIANRSLVESRRVEMAVRYDSSEQGAEKIQEADSELKKILESRRAEIKVVGCGGAGGNTISRLMQVGIVGAETVAVNTDAQDLLYTDSDKKVLIGRELTGGLGAGADPHVGMEAAKESKEDVKKVLEGADMVFIDCGLGGGTGTGSAPIVADVAKKLGALTVGIVTLPFTMEGKQRMRNAQEGLENLESVVDTLIVIPNDKLLEIVPDVSITTAFKVADEILVNAVKGIAELITKPGLVNLDFADIRAVMGSGGLAMIGMGESDTENRAVESVEKALNNPLLDVDIDGAIGALVNVTGGPDITIKECQEIVESVTTKISSDAKVIWGAQLVKELGDTIRALLIVTGVKSSQIYGPDKTITGEKQKEIERVLGVDFLE
jgi:cell division protein FtsZ